MAAVGTAAVKDEIRVSGSQEVDQCWPYSCWDTSLKLKLHLSVSKRKANWSHCASWRVRLPFTAPLTVSAIYHFLKFASSLSPRPGIALAKCRGWTFATQNDINGKCNDSVCKGQIWISQWLWGGEREGRGKTWRDVRLLSESMSFNSLTIRSAWKGHSCAWRSLLAAKWLIITSLMH